MKCTIKNRTGRHRTGKTKCRQIGRVPDIVWRSVIRGFYASNAKHFTKWATRALLNQAKADLHRRKELERIATEILQGTIEGKEESVAPSREKLSLLLKALQSENSDAI